VNDAHMFTGVVMTADRHHLQLLLTVARRYYLDNASQAEIAREIQFSRATVSRLLDEARRRRIVRFQIGHPLERVIALEQALVDRFGLRGARVAEPAPGVNSLAAVAACAAQCLAQATSPDSIVAVSNGSTISAVVAGFPLLRRRDTCVVQMIGTLVQGNPLIDSPEICRRLADSFGGTYRLLPVPLIVGSARLARALRAEESVATALALGSRADVALVGVGATDARGSGAIFAGWLTPEISSDLHRAGAVGHICGHHFDREGRHVMHDLCQRVLSVPLERLTEIRTVIAVAFGSEKVEAITAALRGRHVNVLVTDASTAQAVLHRAS
jgi:DNA-binding transcriptional regulator LsrR (DeoR family)